MKQGYGTTIDYYEKLKKCACRLNLGYEEIRIDGLHEEWQDEVMRIREDFPLDEIAKKLEKVEL
ncbi:hypothetical protein RirG_148310 [Rhizophagus irregularis DAOM 197198w]|uniref:Uncharacterized protein n=1 Tax=Rhizophagus irregularis (strain DAOM 197198w) TaxID=1432141 RepID=A0A015MAJ2_RHIIW|nr:hypothetical protein RirG_148310 [Rhizophagus irregularis DAOM 197198w]